MKSLKYAYDVVNENEREAVLLEEDYTLPAPVEHDVDDEVTSHGDQSAYLRSSFNELTTIKSPSYRSRVC